MATFNFRDDDDPVPEFTPPPAPPARDARPTGLTGQTGQTGGPVGSTPMNSQMINIPFYDPRRGSGIAQTGQVRAGTTIEEFLRSHDCPNLDAYRVNVNGMQAVSGQVLNANDRVSLTPMKVEGQRSR